MELNVQLAGNRIVTWVEFCSHSYSNFPSFKTRRLLCPLFSCCCEGVVDSAREETSAVVPTEGSAKGGGGSPEEEQTARPFRELVETGVSVGEEQSHADRAVLGVGKDVLCFFSSLCDGDRTKDNRDRLNDLNRDLEFPGDSMEDSLDNPGFMAAIGC